ncbi:RICIN domain-containing protein [Streptomyces sp. 62]|uniref:RICIN domain-containing protein n=1 Tax=Streptomyces sp. NPDC013171 TaxID=3364863 RepID=UPI000E39E138
MPFTPSTRVRRVLLTLTASLGLLLGVTSTPAQAAVEPVPNATYFISPQHVSGMCLEVADWRTDNGAPVRQWPCTGGANQKWVRWYDSADPYVYYYKNLNSGKCLEIAGWGTYNGAPAQQWDCHFGANQGWSGTTYITPPYSYLPGKCLEIADWRTDAGAPARQWDCTYQPNQKWTFTWTSIYS